MRPGRDARRVEVDVLEIDLVGAEVVAGVPAGVHHKARVVRRAVLIGDEDRGRDAVGVLRVVLLTAVLEGHLGHERAGAIVLDRRGVEVMRREHEVLPREGALLARGPQFQRLAEHRAHEVEHRVVGGLARLGVALGGVADDPERGLVRADHHRADVVAPRVVEQFGRLAKQVHQPLQRAGRLVLVEPELEVHAHDGEVRALAREDQIERRGVGLLGVGLGRAHLLEHLPRAFEDAEDRLGVAEDVARAHEPGHAALDRQDRKLPC